AGPRRTAEARRGSSRHAHALRFDRRERVEDRECPSGRLAPGELPRSFDPCPRELLAPSVGPFELEQTTSDIAAVERIDQLYGVAAGFRARSGRGHDGRTAAGHRFRYRKSEALVQR